MADPRGVVITEVAFTDDPTVSSPAWTDVSGYVKSSSCSRGRGSELEQVQPGTASFVFRNNDRTFDPSYADGPYYGYLLPMRRIRQRVERAGYSVAPDTLTISDAITDALRATGPTGDGRPYRAITNVFDADDVAQTTLSAAIDNVQTTIAVAAYPSQWPANSSFRIFIDKETLIVTGGFGSTSLTVTRGVAQSWGSAQAAASHSSGAVVTSAMTAQDGWEFKNYADGGIFSDQAAMTTAPSGNRGLKMTVHPGDYNDGADHTRERIEGYWLAAGDTGERHFYRWSNEFPSDFATNNTGSYICQIGPNQSAGNAAFFVRVDSTDHFMCGFNCGVLDTGTFVGTFIDQYTFDIPVTKGVRHDFVLEIDWELTATGKLNLWHREGTNDWELLLGLTSIITSNSLSGATPAIKRKHGIYRSANGSLTNYLYLYDVAQADSWEDAQTDPLDSTDSSTGIWPATTNILTNELLTLSGSTVRTSDSSMQLMGAATDRVDFIATNDYIYRTFAGLTSTNVYTASIWIYREEIDSRFLKFAVRNAANSADVATINIPRQRGWQKVNLTFTATDTSGRVRVIMSDATLKPVRVWMGRAQLEESPVATPFAGFASRTAARARVPAAQFDESQMWMAMRVRPGWSPAGEAGETFPRFFDWRVDSNNLISLFYNESTNNMTIRRQTGGAGSDATQSATGLFNPGEPTTVIFALTASQTKVSVDGAAFSTASNSSIPTLATTFADFGSNSGSSEHMAGDVLWAAWGSGTLTDADAETINGYREDPFPTDSFFPTAGVVQGLWPASDDFYFTNDDAFLFSGFVESWGQSWPDRLFISDTTVTASDAFKVLNLVTQPASNPNVESYADVVAFDEPSFYYRLGEPKGTKVVHHVRKVKRRLIDPAGEFHTVRFKKRWKTRVTRAEAEGVSGPAGTYKNTPTLGAAGAIAGDTDTAVTFVRANSEWARIGPLDADDIAGPELTVAAWVKPTTATPSQTYVAGPIATVSGLPVFELGIFGGAASYTVQQADTTQPAGIGTTTLVAGTWYHLAFVFNGTSNLLYVNGVVENTNPDTPSDLAAVTANGYLVIGWNGQDGSTYANATIDEAVVVPEALSAARILAHYTAGTRGYAQEATGTRIANALDAVALPIPQNLSAGTRDILSVRQFGQATLQPVDEAVEVEGGSSMFFFAANGTATFLDRDYKTNALHVNSAVTIGDSPSDDVRMEDVDISDDEQALFNQVRVEAAGGETQEVNDGPSQDRFFARTMEISGVLMTSDSDALEEATELLARYKEPQQRIRSVVINPGMEDAAEQQAIIRELGDHITVIRRPLGGAAITQDSFIQSIAHEINFEAGSWLTTFALEGVATPAAAGSTYFASHLTATGNGHMPPIRVRQVPLSRANSPVVVTGTAVYLKPAAGSVRLTRSR